jgi:hypothetical protein
MQITRNKKPRLTIEEAVKELKSKSAKNDTFLQFMVKVIIKHTCALSKETDFMHITNVC